MTHGLPVSGDGGAREQAGAAALRPTGLPPVSLRALTAVAALTALPGVDEEQRDPAATTVVSGVTLRSGDVQPGDLFAALPGSKAHGATFAGAAARAGAAAILTDAAGLAMVRADRDAAGLGVLLAADVRAALGPVSSAIYGDPSRHLRVIGVTGTSGKTTTCFLIEAALTAAGVSAGLIGTVGARICGRPLPSALTTPEAPDLQALFAVMRERGVDTIAIEVSSHALALGRVDGTRFQVGAFTNLSQDHLDFHGDMEHYFAAKKLLFDGRADSEVVVVDDEYGRRLAAARPGCITVSARPEAAADWTVTTVAEGLGEQRVHLTGPGALSIETTIGLPGAFNASNAATALAAVHAAGLDPVAAASGLAAVRVPGRMQRIETGQPYLALVDYAHKPAALAAVLDAVRGHVAGRVIVVLGAGGDRDHGKRAVMGEIAAARADLAIITDDNPRSEDPAAIRAQILTGAGGPSDRVREIGDRRAAIRAAVAAARAGDAVLVAGKGHEQGQDVGGVVHHFSDVEELTVAMTQAGEPGAAS